MVSYLITGCSRGLGLELVKQLVKDESASAIFATARSAGPSLDLERLITTSNGRVHFVQLDISSDDSISAAVAKVSSHPNARNGLDVLINNAGIQFTEDDNKINSQALQDSLSINVLSVHKVSNAFIPLLLQGSLKKIVNLSSKMGSISIIAAGIGADRPTPSYKVSKAALNMLTVQYALELSADGFTVFALSPGWLKTEMGGEGAHLSTEVGAQQVLNTIRESDITFNGSFRDIAVPGHDYYRGGIVPW
ncbi:hypothetical protein Plec18167_009102 [Paecilomyces lecythidis]|uniref:Uncharacterized protein n=1 Tax=Paecilomyces lecythidis TaxID=3004212 RepID=A0ABR3WS20_9EURO